MGDVAISVQGVSKSFKLPHERYSGLKQTILNFKFGKKYETQRVLRDISFEIKKGEFFGIVGRNGSGKSTLLKLLAQIYPPDGGAIHVNGSLTPFIELGVGFNPELTGRENIFLNGALLGFDRNKVAAMYDEIVDFAELHRFMDQKLKNYSSGMQVRLAFSIAVRAQSDVLLIDEVLAVGDGAFQRKCFDHFMTLKRNKKTVVLVTHDMSAVRRYCDRAILIEDGKIIDSGSPEEIAQAYQRQFNNELTDEITNVVAFKDGKDKDKHWGSGKMSALAPSVKVGDDFITIDSEFIANIELTSPVFGFTIYGPSGINILEGNTLRMNYKTPNLKAKQNFKIVWQVPNIFSAGRYDVSVACCDRSTTEFYDWFNNASTFVINKEGSTAGIADPPIKIASDNG